MLAKLKKSCPTCTASSQKTYFQSIKALALFAGKQTIPENGSWLTGTLLKKIKKLPLNRYKRFAIAGVKALKAYGNETNKIWWESMKDATEKYTKMRLTGKRTAREAQRWPTGGYAAIKKLAKTLHKHVDYIEDMVPKKISPFQLYQYQKYAVILFYSHHALRGDLADVKIKGKHTPGSSWLTRSKKKWKIHIGHHKTIKSRGPIEFEVHPTVGNVLDIFIPMVKANTSHGYLLSTSKGSKLLRADMLKMISVTTQKHLGKKIGVQILRVLKTTQKLKNLDSAYELQEEMGHSAGMQRQYISRK